MLGIERKITDWIRRYYFIIFWIFAFIAGIKLRKMGLEFVSSDFQNYLQPWYDTMKANTGFKGLVLDFYTYYIPYMCLIAIATYFESLDYIAVFKGDFRYGRACLCVLWRDLRLQAFEGQKRGEAICGNCFCDYLAVAYHDYERSLLGAVRLHLHSIHFCQYVGNASREIQAGFCVFRDCVCF